jgi:serine/threonine-protein kinase
LGIVLYALTTGKHPFRRESEAATMYNICAPQPVMPPRKVNAAYPPEVERIIIKALAKEPEKRYQTANEMLRDLDQLPSSLRASTDEEVAFFVRKLFGAKRDERQAALAEALIRADEVAKHRQTSPGFVVEPMRPSLHSSSSVSVVTGTGAMQAGEMSGTGVVTSAGIVSARRRLVMLASVAVAVLLVAAIGLSVTLRNPEPAKAAVGPGATKPGANNDPASAASLAAQADVIAPVLPSALASAVPLTAETHAAETHAVGASNNEGAQAKPKSGPSAGAAVKTPAAAANAATPVPKPTNPSAPKWKHDPGF